MVTEATRACVSSSRELRTIHVSQRPSSKIFFSVRYYPKVLIFPDLPLPFVILHGQPAPKHRSRTGCAHSRGGGKYSAHDHPGHNFGRGFCSDP